MRTYTVLPRNIPSFAALMTQQALRRANQSQTAQKPVEKKSTGRH